jgi:hypothetical protein
MNSRSIFLKVSSSFFLIEILLIGCRGQISNQVVSTSIETVQPESILKTPVVISTQVISYTLNETPTPTLPAPPSDRLWWEFPTSLSPSLNFDYAKLWQLEFDPKVWELQMTEFHRKQLAHTNLNECIIFPTVGHGLPSDYSVEQSFKRIGANDFEVIQISHNKKLESINYCTAVADSYTCFGLHLGDQPNLCIDDAEVVLSTLVSIEHPQ